MLEVEHRSGVTVVELRHGKVNALDLELLAWPELTVFELRDRGYVLEATSTQPLTVPHPFTVTITQADLTRGLLRQQ